jgi:hypothetical protein
MVFQKVDPRGLGINVSGAEWTSVPTQWSYSGGLLYWSLAFSTSCLFTSPLKAQEEIGPHWNMNHEEAKKSASCTCPLVLGDARGSLESTEISKISRRCHLPQANQPGCGVVAQPQGAQGLSALFTNSKRGIYPNTDSMAPTQEQKAAEQQCTSVFMK